MELSRRALQIRRHFLGWLGLGIRAGGACSLQISRPRTFLPATRLPRHSLIHSLDYLDLESGQ
jgi:hypothetical protein